MGRGASSEDSKEVVGIFTRSVDVKGVIGLISVETKEIWGLGTVEDCGTGMEVSYEET